MVRGSFYCGGKGKGFEMKQNLGCMEIRNFVYNPLICKYILVRNLRGVHECAVGEMVLGFRRLDRLKGKRKL